MEETELVEIMPIEYHLKVRTKRNPRLQIYWNYSFSDNLTLDRLSRVVSTLKNKDKISLQSFSDRYILWKYKGKPQICLDKLTRKVFVSRNTLEDFGRKRCRQQASLVLRILRSHGLANFKRISVTFNPYRIGRTAQEREITFQAAHELFNDRLKV